MAKSIYQLCRRAVYFTLKSSVKGAEGTVHIHIFHAALQTWLNCIRIPSICPHYDTPTQAGEYRPRILGHPSPHDFAEPRLFLYCQLCQSKHCTRKHIDDDLLVNAALIATAEDGITSNKSGKEGVRPCFFAVGRGEAEE